jgi:3'-5' exoribonuclease
MRLGRKARQSLLSSKQVRVKRNGGGSYLHLALGDRTGLLEAKMWDGIEAAGGILVDDFVKVRARVSSYQGKAELVVERIRKAAQAEVHLDDFMPRTTQDVDLLWAQLTSFIEQIDEPPLRDLLTHICNTEQELLRTAPAAKRIHHAYLGGLIEHVVSLCRLCHLVQRTYPWLNRDLLVAAAILHDIGKVHELQFDRRIDYSDRGRLIGHVVIGLQMIQAAVVSMPSVPDDLIILVEHLVLSHHGERELGAPVEPSFAEALAFHFLDNLDAKLASIKQALETTDGSRNWTGYIQPLGRSLLKLDTFWATRKTNDEARPETAALDEKGDEPTDID